MSELSAARSTKGAICTLIFRAKNVAPNAIKRISNKIARYEVQKRRRPLQDDAGVLSWAFPNLTDDVVLGILTFCGIPGVLTVSQTCRHLHNLAFSKALWVEIVSDLRIHSFIDLPSTACLNAFSTAQLITLVRRSVEGPLSWSPSYQSRPVLLHRQTLNVSFVPAEFTLLCGGCYLLCHNSATMTCWNLENGTLVWTYTNDWKCGVKVSSYAAEVVGEGKAIVIVLCLRLDRQELPSFFLNVVRVNLLTGTACSLVLIPLVPAAYSKSFICGDFAAVELRPTSEWFPLVLVINVASQACTLLRFAPVISMVLVPGHLIVAQSSSFWNRTVLKLWSMQSFVGAPGPIMAEEIPHLSIDHIGSPTPHVGGSLRVSAHLSPLHHDAYTVWVVVVENGEMMTVRQYRLLLHLQPPQLLIHSTVRGPTGGYTSWTRSGPSYAGFMSVTDVTWRRRFILSLKNTPSRILMDHDIDAHVHCLVHVSAYSGAITHAKDDQIVVDYYL